MLSNFLHVDTMRATEQYDGWNFKLHTAITTDTRRIYVDGLCQALQSAFKKMDKNNDERISFDEQISYQQAQKELLSFCLI